MIRFSAALVAVAIGVLLGGIATSKLLLVYIAIVVSAVALLALAIGVVLKREELFGEDQGLVPATAGASPVLPARAGESQGKVPAGAHVAPPPPYAGAAAGYAAFGGNVPSAPAGVDRSGRPAPSGQGRPAGTASARPASASPVPANPAPASTVSANTVSAKASTAPANTGSAGAVPPWEATPAARGPWSSSTADWMPSGQDERAADAGTQGGRAGGWRVAEADAQAAAKAPRSWAAPSSPAPSSSAAPDAPPVTPASEPSSAAPSWFDRLGGPAGTDVPTVPPGSGGGWPWSSREGGEPGGPAAWEDTTGTDGAATTAAPTVSGGPVSGDTVSGDTLPSDTASSGTADAGTADAGTADAGAADEDDWPARYSWLDDDTDEAGEVTGTAGETAHRAGETPPGADDAAQAAGASATVGAPTADAPVAPPAAETVAAPVLGAGTLVDEPGDAPAAEDGADIIAFPGAAPDPGTASDDAPEAPPGEAGRDGDAAGEAEGDPPATAKEDDAEAGPGLVTVVPGVPRYHRTDCVLIRFMPAGDVHQVPVSEARDAGCTPCAACQPEG